MNEIQKLEFKILQDVTKVCDDYGIEYMLYGGTLLGAVRHGGFIPWDDDIDICMTTPNYFRFLEIAPAALGANYFVQNYKTDSEYYDLWTHIRLNGTTSMPINQAKWNIHFGITIDVFPIIGVPENKKEKERQIKCFNWHRTLLSDKYMKAIGEHMTWKQHSIYMIPRCIRRFICKRLDKYIYSDVVGSETVAFVWYKLIELPKEMFNGLTYLEFEGQQFKAMSNYKMFLNCYYGDYMQLPPEDERTGHDLTLGEIIYDTKNSYKMYQ